MPQPAIPWKKATVEFLDKRKRTPAAFTSLEGTRFPVSGFQPHRKGGRHFHIISQGIPFILIQQKEKGTWLVKEDTEE